MSTLSLRKIKHDSSSVDNITLGTTGRVSIKSSGADGLVLETDSADSTCSTHIFAKSNTYTGGMYYDNTGWNITTGSTIGSASGLSSLNITRDGHIRSPYQPSFLAVRNDTIIPSNTAITFQSTQHNIGSYYNTSNGRFTAPVAGMYSITWGCLSGTDATVYRYTLWKNDSLISINGNVDTFQIRLDCGSGIDYLQGTKTVNLYLQANDFLTVIYSSDNASSAQNSSWAFFSGYLVG